MHVRWRRLAWLLQLCALTAAVSHRTSRADGAEVSDQIRTVLDAHERALGLIHSLDLRIDVQGWDNVGPRVKQGRTEILSARWSRKGTLERIRTELHGRQRDEKGRPVNLADIFRDGSKTRILRNWDPADPQPITPRHQGTVSAYVEDQTASVGDHDPACSLLLAFPLGGSYPARHTLADLVRQAPKVHFLNRIPQDGGELWQIRLDHPGRDGQPAPAGSYVDVVLDPAANYLAQRLTVHIASQQVVDFESRQRRTVSVDMITEIKRFHSCGDGVFFPIESEYRFVRSDHKSPTMVSTFSVKDLRVNEPLAADAFDFRFPEHAIVVHKPVNGVPKRQLWGGDNQPIRTITSMKDLHPFVSGSRSGRWIGTCVAIAMTCAGLLWFLVHRWRGQTVG